MNQNSSESTKHQPFPKTCAKGEIVFHEGEIGNEMYVIRNGSVSVTKKVRGKVEQLAKLEKWDFFGEMALLNRRPRSATVICLEECSLTVLDKESFESYLRSDVDVAIRFIQKLSQRLQLADELIENLMLGGGDRKLVESLKKIAGKFNDYWTA